MRAMPASRLALGMCLLILGGSVLGFQVRFSSTPPVRQGEPAAEIILDYEGSMNCESDLWNNENSQNDQGEQASEPANTAPASLP